MQSLAWYARRLRAMTPGEAAGRVRATLRDVVDPALRPLRVRRAHRKVRQLTSEQTETRLVPADLPVGRWGNGSATAAERAWARGLAARAQRLANGRHRVFDVDDLWLGDPIDWNRDAKHGVAAPRQYAGFIDYRDFRVTGDAKFVWEPNRHHHLVVLARAYRATGDVAYARAVAEQWRQWLDQCPFGTGMNWRSPLELAVRLINWVWALDLVRTARVVDSALHERLMSAAYLHLWEISRKYSGGSSANNHRIGEAAGVYIGSTYFADLDDAPRWRAASRRILCAEIEAQTYPDGGSREQAVGYQFFVLQFFLLAGILARRSGDDFPPAYWERLRRMCAFVAALGEGGPYPLFGDCDDGYVLDVDAGPHDVRPWLATAAILLDDGTLKPGAGPMPEAPAWLLGPSSAARYQALASPPSGRVLESRAFPESGYYLLQGGRVDQPEAVSVVFDCGPLGMGALAAHGHADALSFALRVGGADVLVDPGTYDYFTYPAWRNYFRSTRAHNTVVVDEMDQSVMLGPFLWGERAQAHCREWTPTANGGRVVGEHDGYRRLADPVVHRRALELDGERRELRVTDELIGRGRHGAAACFHLAESARLVEHSGQRLLIEVGATRVELVFDRRLDLNVLHGSEQPIGGWVSRGYHRKSASLTVVGRCAYEGRLDLATRIRWEPGSTAPGA